MSTQPCRKSSSIHRRRPARVAGPTRIIRKRLKLQDSVGDGRGGRRIFLGCVNTGSPPFLRLDTNPSTLPRLNTKICFRFPSTLCPLPCFIPCPRPESQPPHDVFPFQSLSIGILHHPFQKQLDRKIFIPPIQISTNLLPRSSLYKFPPFLPSLTPPTALYNLPFPGALWVSESSPDSAPYFRAPPFLPSPHLNNLTHQTSPSPQDAAPARPPPDLTTHLTTRTHTFKTRHKSPIFQKQPPSFITIPQLSLNTRVGQGEPSIQKRHQKRLRAKLTLNNITVSHILTG